MVFRVQQEKEVAQELMQISQILQNFADRDAIDYPKYFALSSKWLVDVQWVADVLYLSWKDGQISIYSSGSLCTASTDEYVFSGGVSTCSLYMLDAWGHEIQLTNPKKIAISQVLFKIIPFASESDYLSNDTLCTTWNYLHCLNDPWFRMIFKAYSSSYGKQRATHVVVPFQQFF